MHFDLLLVPLESASSEQDVFLKEDELEETDQREQLSIQPTQRKKKREHQSKAAELIEKINRSKKSSRKTFPLSGTYVVVITFVTCRISNEVCTRI